MYKPLKINILGIFSNFFSILFGKLKYLLYIRHIPTNDKRDIINKTQLGVKIGYTKNTKKW